MILKNTAPGLRRFDLIQAFIDEYGYTRYLELGSREGSINRINCMHKDSVDINRNENNYVMSTDEFFNTIESTRQYDIIFIDANHDKEFVYRDIINSLAHLSEGGCIICHDISPPSEMHLQHKYCSSAWETWALLRSTRTDLEMNATLIDAVGLGIIRRGYQQLYSKQIEYTWNYLESNRHELLHIIDEDMLEKLYFKLQ